MDTSHIGSLCLCSTSWAVLVQSLAKAIRQALVSGLEVASAILLIASACA